MSSPDVRVIYLQDGARLHYAIPLSLHRENALCRMYTNWFSSPRSMDRVLATAASFVSKAKARKMLERYCAELPRNRVRSCPFRTLVWASRKRRMSATDFYAWESRVFGRWVERKGLLGANWVAGFVRNISPELLGSVRSRGLATCCDQIIAPRAIEIEEEFRQTERFPGWSTEPPSARTDPVRDIEIETWRNSTLITCASDYVRAGLMAQGVPESKVHVLPYPIDIQKYRMSERRDHKGPLTVGFVGSVGLRKGAPYFFEIAKRFASQSVKFQMVGPVSLSSAAVSERGNVELVGAVARGRVIEYMEKFDLFLFPSTCEGSAGAVTEAMATGLPVIASKNSGSPGSGVLPFHDLNYDDTEEMCRALEQLISRQELRQEVARRGRELVEQFSIDEYGRRLINLMGAC